MSKPKELVICCLCKKNEYEERYGHRAQPIEDGTCCSKCNIDIVIPLRMLQLFGDKMDTIEELADKQVKIMEAKNKSLTTKDLKELVTLSADALRIAKESEVVLNQLLKGKGN